MVCAGLPSSQRKRFGAANQTCPVETSGCVNDFNERVCVKSADHVWMFVWFSNHFETNSPASSARAESELKKTAKLASIKNFFIFLWTHLLPAKLEQNDTIAL